MWSEGDWPSLAGLPGSSQHNNCALRVLRANPSASDSFLSQHDKSAAQSLAGNPCSLATSVPSHHASGCIATAWQAFGAELCRRKLRSTRGKHLHENQMPKNTWAPCMIRALTWKCMIKSAGQSTGQSWSSGTNAWSFLTCSVLNGHCTSLLSRRYSWCVAPSPGRWPRHEP